MHAFLNDHLLAIPLAWSPDSRYLAVSLQTDGPRIASDGLAVIDTKTMTATTIATGAIRGASFAPSGPDRLVYGQQALSSQSTDRVMDLYTVNPDGSDRTQLTSDGDSLQPLWTAKGIVYDRETPAILEATPTYQLWVLHDGHSTQLTRRASVEEIFPRAASANGNRLIANYEGLGSERAEAVELSPRRIRSVGGGTVWGAGISQDGQTLLLERGATGSPATPGTGLQPLPPHDGVVETAPFGGGQPTRIADGNSPAWNG